MKKLYITMAAVAVAFASCTSVEDEPKIEDGLVSIAPSLVSENIIETSNGTRSAINTGNNTVSVVVWDPNAATISDDFMGKNEPKKSTGTHNVTSLTSNSTAASLTLTPARYYNANASNKSFMYAFFPAIGTDNVSMPTTGSTNMNVVTIGKQDGTVDLCVSNLGNGTKTSAQPSLTLGHQTAWISFEVKTDGSVTTGTCLKELVLLGAQVPTSMTLHANGTPEISMKTAGNLTVYTAPTTPDLTITSTAKSAGKSFYTMPVNANILKIKAKTIYQGVETEYAGSDGNGILLNTTAIEKGNHYAVTLTFKQQSITPSVTVTKWNNKTIPVDIQ